MSRTSGWKLAAAAVSLAVALAGCGENGPRQPGGEVKRESKAGGGERATATLFFPGSGETLVKEERDLPAGELEDRIRAIVLALLDGPEGSEGKPILPDDVTLTGVYLGASGVAFLDLHRPDNGPPPPMGSLQETLLAYSLVNSVALNVPEVERVSLLWNGVQRPSLAGHLDNAGPLEPRPQLAR